MNTRISTALTTDLLSNTRLSAINKFLADGDTVTLEIIIRAKHMYNAKDPNTLAIFSALLHHFKRDNKHLGSLLLDLLRDGNTECAKVVISHPSFDAGAKRSRSLGNAVCHNNVEIVSLLISKGANPADGNGAILAAAVSAGNVRIVELLVTFRTVPLEKGIRMAIIKNNAEILKILLAQERCMVDARVFSVSMKQDVRDLMIASPRVSKTYLSLSRALMHYNFATAKALLNCPFIDPTVDNCRILSEVVRSGNISIVSFLFEDSRIKVSDAHIEEAKSDEMRELLRKKQQEVKVV